jgi:hypothetical protein
LRAGLEKRGNAPFDNLFLPLTFFQLFRIHFGAQRKVAYSGKDTLEFLQRLIVFSQSFRQLVEPMSKDTAIGARPNRKLVVVVVDEKGPVLIGKPQFALFQHVAVLVLEDRE